MSSNPALYCLNHADKKVFCKGLCKSCYRKQTRKSITVSTHLCECNCGHYTNISQGRNSRFLKGHGTSSAWAIGSFQGIGAKSSKAQTGKEPTYSPFIPNKIVWFNEKNGRWTGYNSVTHKSMLHARLVWQHYFGIIQDGSHVHHKSGKATELADDRPENLMLLPAIWNGYYFPVLSKGFEVHESVITEIYIQVLDLSGNLFSNVCQELIRRTGKYYEQ